MVGVGWSSGPDIKHCGEKGGMVARDEERGSQAAPKVCVGVWMCVCGRERRKSRQCSNCCRRVGTRQLEIPQDLWPLTLLWGVARVIWGLRRSLFHASIAFSEEMQRWGDPAVGSFDTYSSSIEKVRPHIHLDEAAIFGIVPRWLLHQCQVLGVSALV